MSFWESKDIKKTRKQHTCEYCGAKIPIGSSCRNEVGVYEGDFNHYYLCLRCIMFMNIFTDRQDEMLGEFIEALYETDLLNCPKCGCWRGHKDWAEDMQSVNLECRDCDHNWAVDLSLEALEKL